MTRRNTFLKVGLTSAAATVLALAITVPVSAHTGSLFTVVQGSDGAPSTFATISASDATRTSVGGELADGAEGIEIFDETAYAIVENTLITWDHSTGELLTSVTLTVSDEYELGEVFGLDTTADGTLLAYARLDVSDGDVVTTEDWVVSIDSATGALTPRVEVTDVDPYLDSLATNPVTGVTYSFVDLDDGVPQYVVVDLDAGTHGDRVNLEGIIDSIGGGYFGGADFDVNGTLWFYYFGGGDSAILASTVGDFGAASTAVVSGPVSNLEFVNLAYDPFAAPAPVPAPAPAQLPATGVDASALAIGAAGLLGAGLLALFFVRRRTA